MECFTWIPHASYLLTNEVFEVFFELQDNTRDNHFNTGLNPNGPDKLF